MENYKDESIGEDSNPLDILEIEPSIDDLTGEDCTEPEFELNIPEPEDYPDNC